MLFFFHPMFHNHLKLLWKFQTCVFFLISYSWHRERDTHTTHTHTHLDMRLYQQWSSFLSSILLKNVVSCWNHVLLVMNEWMNEWMSVKPWWNDTDRWKLKYLEENLVQCYYDCHKFDRLAWHWTSMVRGRWLPGTGAAWLCSAIAISIGNLEDK